MTKNKKQGGRTKMVGWDKWSGTVSGDVRDAIPLIAAIQKRDAGKVVDELLRKAGILDLLDTLIQERLAKQAAKAKQKEFDEMLGKNPEYHRIFAECVFEELERTHRICSFEAALRIRGYFPEFGEVDDWRLWKKIPFEYHQVICQCLERTGWDARLQSFLRSMPPSLNRGVTPLATGTTDSPLFLRRVSYTRSHQETDRMTCDCHIRLCGRLAFSVFLQVVTKDRGSSAQVKGLHLEPPVPY